ncbi:MAG TPA: chromate resistance protein ChrB domain-containing protein [bacterium]|nr:chromate resistance protein ChrB domain-containing protein [bacterium]
MSWLVFSYSLPSKARSSPRVAVWRRLRTLGAVSPKSGVYVLPGRPECMEAFQWLAQEVEDAKGEALLMHVDRFEGMSDQALVALFQGARRKDYEALSARVAEFRRSLKGARAGSGGARDALAKLRREHAEVARIDFFESPGSTAVAAELDRLEQHLAPAAPSAGRVERAALETYRTARWVTRPQPHVDRLACVWLIRRFVNPRAVVRYAPAAEPDEVPFDVPGAAFGHHGNLCTFETMLRAFDLDDPGLRAVAEIVHEIDLRDGRFSRPEVAGADAILGGWGGLGDAEREAHGVALFEGLYTSLARARTQPTRRLTGNRRDVGRR